MQFKDIVGQEAAKKRLREMADADRLPHALLLAGAPGTGALALARALAQYIHCTHRTPEGDSCGRCVACRQHQELNNADMHYAYPVIKKKAEKLLISDDYAPQWRRFLEQGGAYPVWEDWLEAMKAGNSQPAIHVDESDDIVRKMNLSNFAARYKVLLLWLPEKLQPEAANKLLKIIEEPYADTKFILVSNNPAEILPTIYSRTQRVDVPRVPAPLIAGYLERTLGVDAPQAARLAESADGSVAAAVQSAGVQGERGEFGPLFQQMMRKAYMRDVKAMRQTADKVAEMGREKSRRFLLYCAAQVRENFMYNLAMPELLRLDADEMRFSSRFAPFIHAGNAEQMLAEFQAAEADIAGNANAKIVMFDTLLRLIPLLLTHNK